MSAGCATFQVEGMSCASCARAIERAVGRRDGVHEASVNYAARTLTVRFDSAVVASSALALAVEDAGYRVVAGAEDDERTSRLLRVRLAVTAFFAMQAMLPTLAVWIDGAALTPGTRYGLSIASGVLSLPAIFYGGWPFHARAWRSIRERAPGMDLLVSLGALSAFVASVVALALGSDRTWFDTASSIVFFLLFGRWIEDGARRRGFDAIHELSRLSPDRARRLGDDGRLEELRTEELRPGDVVRVLPGERIPVDGVIVAGASRVDRSLLTGESLPVERDVASTVEAGTLAVDGALDLRTTAVVGDRALDRIVSAVDRLLARRAPLQALADRVAAKLVYVVLGAAAITAVLVAVSAGNVAEALIRAIAVVVIACPCALGLATPMAILVAAGRAARRGILFRDAEAIERAAEIEAVYFDKTGTLTEGRPAITEVHPSPGVAAEEVTAAAAIAESSSEHPLSRALARTDVPSPPGRTRAVPGEGVIFESEDGHRFVAGSARLFSREGLVAPECASRGTLVHVARDGRTLGTIVLADRVRAGAGAAVARLLELGLDVAMLTGDRRVVADEIARALSVASVSAELSPLDKVARIRESGRRVAFVGDGLNDGPALAAGHLGVAVDGATDVALATAHVSVREGGVARVVEALELARRTRRVMRANVAWGIGYNAVAIPLASLGLVRPELAALLMAMSSISVVLSSLRLGSDPCDSVFQDVASANSERAELSSFARENVLACASQ